MFTTSIGQSRHGQAAVTGDFSETKPKLSLGGLHCSSLSFGKVLGPHTVSLVALLNIGWIPICPSPGRGCLCWDATTGQLCWPLGCSLPEPGPHGQSGFGLWSEDDAEQDIAWVVALRLVLGDLPLAPRLIGRCLVCWHNPGGSQPAVRGGPCP